VIDQAEVGDEVFTVSEMTVEAHSYPSGTVLGFNGTTEWALDSVALDDAVWLPSESQLREILRGGFKSLTVTEEGRFRVDIVFRDEPATFVADDADDAYGEAVLHLVTSATVR